MACFYCKFSYYMRLCPVCNYGYYCGYCESNIDACFTCSQKKCNKCKIDDTLILCSECSALYCKNCIIQNEKYSGICNGCNLYRTMDNG